MALPVGISTCAVTFGGDYDFAAGLVSAKITVTPTADVVWAATGQRLVSFNITATADAGMSASIALPHVDQDGFTDGSGTPYTMWAYKLFVEYTGPNSGAREDVTKPFQPLVGQTTVDFDNIPGGVITIPVSAPVMPVTSLNGETGALTGFATVSDLSDYVPLWQPNTAYVIGQAVVNPDGDVVTATSNFTSGSTYTGTHWALSLSYVAVPTQGSTIGTSSYDAGTGLITTTVSTQWSVRPEGMTVDYEQDYSLPVGNTPAVYEIGTDGNHYVTQIAS